MDTRVPFWQTNLGDAEAAAVRSAFAAGNLGQGHVTAAFEREFASAIGAPYAVATVNGTTALYLAAVAGGIQAGDEVIVPARTFISPAHAMMLAGATVKLVDCGTESPLIEVDRIEAAVTPRTKAIVPVHLNGNGCDMTGIRDIAKRYNLFVLEDAAQAYCSQVSAGYLGTLADAGAFSLGVTKFITTGQGGVAVTPHRDIYENMLRLRNHGGFETFESGFNHFGLNLKFNDILASVGLVQLKKLREKRQRHIEIYRFYERTLAEIPNLRLVPVDLEAGCIPLWIEASCRTRDDVISRLDERGIQCRPSLPSLSSSAHLRHHDANFPNAVRFGQTSMFLPCGPDLPQEGLERTARELRALTFDRV